MDTSDAAWTTFGFAHRNNHADEHHTACLRQEQHRSMHEVALHGDLVAANVFIRSFRLRNTPLDMAQVGPVARQSLLRQAPKILWQVYISLLLFSLCLDIPVAKL